MSNFIFHQSDSSWGSDIMIMEKEGKAFARLYWYSDDNESAYLNWLSVNELERNKGLGTELQILREQLAKDKGFTKCWLQVEDNSWMHNWYKRRGYIDNLLDKDNEELMWMYKEI